MCRCFAFAAAAVCALSAGADSLSVRMLPGERWWGVCNSFGTNMPFTAATQGFKADLFAWNYGGQRIIRDHVALRQKFAPKFVELARRAGETGEPIMRYLEYSYPGMGYAEIRDQFMMGDDLLVAPVVEKGATSRKVILPPGNWKADDGRIYNGPATIDIPAPLSRLPYFERL